MTSTELPIIFLYDIPKDGVTSVKLTTFIETQYAKYIAEHEELRATEEATFTMKPQPQILRDLYRPFYSARIQVPDAQKYKAVSKILRYFDLNEDGRQSRGLPFDPEIRNKKKEDKECYFKDLAKFSLFVKNIPENMRSNDLEEFFSKIIIEKTMNEAQVAEYTKAVANLTRNPIIKSCKVSINQDYTSRRYGYVTFDDENHVEIALKATENNTVVTGSQYIYKGKRDMRMIFNNIYIKNLPLDHNNEEKIRELFAPFGHITSCKVNANEIGAYAFVCYGNKDDPNDRESGPKAALAAIEAMHGHKIGENVLYVQEALKSEQRRLQRERDTLKYKTSKQKFNLYVRGFPEETTEKDLEEHFAPCGKIESLRMFPKDTERKTYAFVCFETIQAAEEAKKRNTTFKDRHLTINNYEIKEIRALKSERTKDTHDFQQHLHRNSDPAKLMSGLDNQALFALLQKLIQQYQTGPKPRMGGSYNNRSHPNNMGQQRRTMPNVQQPRAQHPGGMYAQQPPMQQPPHMQGVPPQMPPPQNMAPPMMNQSVDPAARDFYEKANQVLPSVKEENPYYKQQVGHVIYETVVAQVGAEKAPKITGMLIDLPVAEITNYLRNIVVFRQRVQQASQLLVESPQ